MPEFVREIDAVYTETANNRGNPVLQALPPMLEKKAAFQAMEYLPPEPSGKMTMTEIQEQIARLPGYFMCMDYMYVIYERLYRAIQTTYMSRDTIEAIRRTCKIYNGLEQPVCAHVDSGSILGVPGIGKTTTIKRCLSLLPQVIRHRQFQGHLFYCAQITWLFVECPSDCSIKALILNAIKAVDEAIGSEYLARNVRYSMPVHALAIQFKIICQTHHIGLLVVDECQNLVSTARDGKQTKPLIRFLVELTNETNTAIWMVGTPIAEDVFSSVDHLKRRTRGFRLLPFKPDGEYRRFLSGLWRCQYTPAVAELTDKMASVIYDRTGGIPGYIVHLYQEIQTQAVFTGKRKMDVQLVNETARLLAIDPPKKYLVGTSISDFSAVDIVGGDVGPESESVVQTRTYATKRGRKPVPRDEKDILVLYKNTKDIYNEMNKLGLIEERKC